MSSELKEVLRVFCKSSRYLRSWNFSRLCFSAVLFSLRSPWILFIFYAIVFSRRWSVICLALFVFNWLNSKSTFIVTRLGSVAGRSYVLHRIRTFTDSDVWMFTWEGVRISKTHVFLTPGLLFLTESLLFSGLLASIRLGLQLSGSGCLFAWRLLGFWRFGEFRSTFLRVFMSR